MLALEGLHSACRRHRRFLSKRPLSRPRFSPIYFLIAASVARSSYRPVKFLLFSGPVRAGCSCWRPVSGCTASPLTPATAYLLSELQQESRSDRTPPRCLFGSCFFNRLWRSRRAEVPGPHLSSPDRRRGEQARARRCPVEILGQIGTLGDDPVFLPAAVPEASRWARGRAGARRQQRCCNGGSRPILPYRAFAATDSPTLRCPLLRLHRARHLRLNSLRASPARCSREKEMRVFNHGSS